jgi:glycosyltransferase involved in cell wall biosynthesis
MMPRTVEDPGAAHARLSVVAETAYPQSVASARVRLAGFAPFLRAHGVGLEFRPTLTDDQYAVVVGERRPAAKLRALTASMAAVARGPHAEAARLLLVHRLRSLIPVPVLEFLPRVDAYDFDDAIYAGSGPGTGNRSRIIKAEAWRWSRYVRSARLVVAGNGYLASAAREQARRVEVVPSCVDPASYPIRRHRDHSPVTVGWIGSRTTTPFLEDVLPAFERVNRGRVQARLLVVGGNPLPSFPWLEQRPWSLDREAADLAELDIGIMPLPDTPWTRAKCGYKVLQYFAAGLPVIASPVGVNAGLVGDDRGHLPTSIEGWQAALSDLSSDAAARRQMGAAGRRLGESEYSYQRWAPELAAMLTSL